MTGQTKEGKKHILKSTQFAKEPSFCIRFRIVPFPDTLLFMYRKLCSQPRNLDYNWIHFRSGRAQEKTEMNLYCKTSIQFQSSTEAIVECNVSGYNSRTGFRKPSSSSLEKEKRFQTTEHFGPPNAIIVQQQP